MSKKSYNSSDNASDQTLLLISQPVNPSYEVPDSTQAKATTFAEKWEGYQGSEPAHYQAHFNELCQIVDHETPSDSLDSHDFEFQQPAPAPGKHDGIADVWLKGHFVMEYKKPGKSLDEAYTQTLKYRDSLGNPPLLITSDFNQIRIHTNFTGTVSDTYTITLDDLRDLTQLATLKTALGIERASPLSVFQVLRYCFYEPGNLKPTDTPEKLTQAAADIFREISDELQIWNPHKHSEIARFLSQLLFCMFASDMGLLSKNLMTQYTQELGQSPATIFPQRLGRLFEKMSQGDPVESPPIKHFDGGLFDGRQNDLQIGSSLMPLVQQADALDWSQIEPSIFGTFFERVFNPEKRAQHGRHYTSREDIETIVEPVVLMPLRREWDALRPQLKTATQEEVSTKIQSFIDKIGAIRILDPACGSGNFLYVVLNLLHALEREIIAWSLQFQIKPPQPRVHPRQLLGIENEEYAHQLASIVVWIGHIQNELRAGTDIESREPILDPLDNMELRDAIIDLSSGKPEPAEWPEADIIVGNPPFLGNKRMREEMGDDAVETIYQAWQGKVPHGADLCAYWFEKARIQIQNRKAERAGLLATQAIRGGRSRVVLQNIKRSGDIFFAESDREWRHDGAAVRTSMVGFDDGSETVRILDGEHVDKINPDLTSRPADLTNARKLAENQGIAFQGMILVGPFDLSEEEAEELIKTPNPDEYDNADVIKPYITAKDITDRPSNRWVIDFGVDATRQEAARYELPFNTVKDRVRSFREKENTRSTANQPCWLFANPGRGIRAAIKPLDRYLATPLHSKYRVFVWVNANRIPNHSIGVFACEDDYFMGILQSRVHEVWSFAMGTQLESRPRYTHTTCFETFPFPNPTEEQKQRIAKIAHRISRRRVTRLTPYEDTPEEIKRKLTMTNLYNDYPEWLLWDHEFLDHAVFAAYNWAENPGDLDDDTILQRLLELNLEREPA